MQNGEIIFVSTANLATHFCDVVGYPDTQNFNFTFLKNDHKSAQMCAPWVGRLPIIFENVFEVICDHMIHGSNLKDFPKAKKYITKVRCQVTHFMRKFYLPQISCKKFLRLFSLFA